MLKNTKKNRSVYILIGILTFLVGITLKIQPDGSSLFTREPRFKQLSSGSFLSSGAKPYHANDCIGCPELYGDINVSHTSDSVDNTKYTLNANCVESFGDVIEKGFQLNERGKQIGERCVIVAPNGEARIFWTEGNKDYWIITAPSLELVREFESSETFRLAKSRRFF